jgi:6-phosphogluconolactonase (cycloisomerase 2 family)
MQKWNAATAAIVVVGFTSIAACSGSSGAAGPEGAAGKTGATGEAGPTGKTGATGKAGAPGATGPAGEAGAAAPTPEAGPIVAPNAVYMLSNDATQNEIIEFTRAADGSLTTFGSFPTGGAGTGASLGDQGALAFDPAKNLFYAVNAGDGSISLLALEADGTISLLSKIGSGGVAPNSITFHESTVYVLNAGSSTAAPNITGFTVDPGGLVAIKDATASLSGPATVGGAEILFVAGGSALVVTERLANNIDVFALTDGAPTSAAPTTVFAEPGPSGAVPGSEPFGFALTAEGQIVVSEAWSGTAGLSSSSTFSVTASGTLTEITTGLMSGQSGACWTTVVGKYAYETNTASGTVSQYAIAADGTLSLVGSGLAGTAGGTGAGSTDLTSSADGKYLYVHNGTGALSIFSLSPADGTLTKLPDFVGIPAHAEGLVAR